MLVPSSPYVATGMLPALADPVMVVPHRLAILTMMPIPAITAPSIAMIVARVMPHLVISICAVIVATHLTVMAHLVATVRLIFPVHPAVTLGRIILS
jgi:hypothetical protein